MSTAQTGRYRLGNVTERVDLARAQVAALHAELPRWGLVVWTAGNVSQRVTADPDAGPSEHDLLVIKPSGVTYDELTPESMVVCDLAGNVVDGDRAPSSDTAADAYVYGHMSRVGGLCTPTRLTRRRGRHGERRSPAC